MKRHCGVEMVRVSNGLRCEKCGKFLKFNDRKSDEDKKKAVQK